MSEQKLCFAHTIELSEHYTPMDQVFEADFTMSSVTPVGYRWPGKATCFGICKPLGTTPFSLLVSTKKFYPVQKLSSLVDSISVVCSEPNKCHCVLLFPSTRVKREEKQNTEVRIGDEVIVFSRKSKTSLVSKLLKQHQQEPTQSISKIPTYQPPMVVVELV